MLLCLGILVIPARATTIKTEYEEMPTMILIQENSLVAVFTPDLPIFDASQAIDEDSNLIDRLLKKIIECESNWQNIPNQKYGYKAGQGIAQIIPSTIKYCEEKLDKKIDPFNEEENLECASWLLENEGWRHWGCPDCEWGTYNCFASYIP